MLKSTHPMTDHFRGRLEVFGLADLLQWMELNRRSGRLTVTRGHDRRTLDWKEGEIVYVSGSLPRHRLGVHLLRSGALPAATLYELLARNMTTQENLTRLILEMGHDTLDGLSLRVEDLARKLLFEIFEWREANFEYDPTYRVQPILRIGLTLRGQALAFQGVKQLDDTHRLSRRERRETWEAADAWVLPFLPDGIEEHLWDALERTETALGAVPESLDRTGPRAATVLIDRLSSPDFPALPRHDPASRAVRRASLAAAISAGRFAERYGIGRERGYTLGLLDYIGYSDL